MTKYIVAADVRIEEGTGFDFIELTAKTDLGAIIEADKVYDKKRHYLIQICKATGRAYKEYGETCKAYTTIATKRSNEGGWNDMTHEATYTVIRHDYNGNISYTLQ